MYCTSLDYLQGLDVGAGYVFTTKHHATTFKHNVSKLLGFREEIENMSYCTGAYPLMP
jgi:hypothetical protein